MGGMQKWKRFLYFFFSLICLVVMMWIIIYTSPNQVLPLQSFLVPFYWFFYGALFGFFLFLSKAITTRFIHGISLGIFAIALLLLKTNNLFQPFLIGLLVVLVIALEIAFWQRKKKNTLHPQ